MKCSSPGCDKTPNSAFVFIREQRIAEEHSFCMHHAAIQLDSYRMSRDLPTPEAANEHQVIELELDLIVFREGQELHDVYLRQVRGGAMVVPFSFAYFETSLIYNIIKYPATPRPMTHEAMGMIIRALGATLESVFISHCQGEERYWHAILQLRRAQEIVTLDVRPSDAIALAVKCRVPITIAGGLLKPA